MGSWNGTCALTNLPIREGDRTVVYVLNVLPHCREEGGGGLIEVDAYAHPYGLPLRGLYDSYGGVEDLDDDLNHQWWFKRLTELSPKLMTEDVEPLQDDWLTDVQAFICEGVERGEVYVGPEGKHGDEDYDPTYRLGLMLMHEGAYDRFMATSIASSNWTIPGSPVAYFHKEYAAIGPRLVELQAIMAEADRQMGRLDGPGLRALIDSHQASLKELREMLEIRSCFGWDSREIIASICAQAERTPALFDELAKHHVFNLMLGCARKHWSLQCGAGSGNDDTSLQVALAKFTLEAARRS